MSSAAFRVGVRKAKVAPKIHIADNFTRANSTTSLGSTSTGGYPWTANDVGNAGGTTVFGITNNTAYDVSRGGLRGVTVSTACQDGTVTVTLPSLSASNNGNLTGILMRADTAGNGVYFGCAHGTSFANVSVSNQNGGNSQSLYSTTTAPSTPVTLVLKVVGSGATAVVTATLNGTQVYSGSPSLGVNTSTLHGMYIQDDVTQSTLAVVSSFDFLQA